MDMTWISSIFLNILNMSVTAGIIILAVLAARALLRRTSRKYVYALWIIVAIRLVCPWSPASRLSLFSLDIFQQTQSENGRQVWYAPGESSGMPAGAEANLDTETDSGAENTENSRYNAEGAADAGTSDGNGDDSYVIRQGTDTKKAGNTASEEPQGTGILSAAVPSETESPGAISPVSAAGWGWQEILSLVWLAGAAVFLIYQSVCWRRVRKLTEQAVWYEDNIYECEGIPSPFVMGLIRPRIYIPFRLSDREKTLILLHERCHIRRGDHLIRLFATALLAVYWFHPLVWIAFHCMTADMEMSCDEMVIERMGESVKEDYSRCLLSFAVQGRPAAGIAAFGESAVKSRIRNILSYRKRGILAGAAAVVVLAVLAVALLTNGYGDSVEGPGLKSDGSRQVTGGGSTEYTAQAMDYTLDDRTESVALYKELWMDGEMVDHRVLGVWDTVLDNSVEKQRENQGENGEADSADNSGESRFPVRGSMEIGCQLEGTEYFQQADIGLLLKDEKGEEFGQITDTLDMYTWEVAAVGENYRTEEGNGEEYTEKALSSEEDFVLAAFHLAHAREDGEAILNYIPCEELDDRENGDYRQNGGKDTNDGELIYRMVVSERPAEELMEQYSDSPAAVQLAEAATPDLGDGAAGTKVMDAVNVEGLGTYSTELLSENQPRTLALHFDEEPDDPAAWNRRMQKKAILILALIGNADRVEWTHPCGGDTWRWMIDTDTAGIMTGLDEEDIKGCSDGTFNFNLLWTLAADTERSGRSAEVRWNGHGWETLDGKVYSDRRVLAGVLPNARYVGIVECLTNEENLTYEQAAMLPLSSTLPWPYDVEILGMW